MTLFRKLKIQLKIKIGCYEIDGLLRLSSFMQIGSYKLGIRLPEPGSPYFLPNPAKRKEHDAKKTPDEWQQTVHSDPKLK